MRPKDKMVFAAAAVLVAAGGFRHGLGVYAGCPWWHHLTFHFVHGNVFHLAGNLLAVWLYCKSGRVKVSLWLEAFAVASILSILYFADKPLVGFSGVIMVTLGAFLPRLWKRRDVRVSMMLMAVLSAASLFFGQGWAVLFHALCIASGILLENMKELIHDIKEEERRAYRR